MAFFIYKAPYINENYSAPDPGWDNHDTLELESIPDMVLPLITLITRSPVGFLLMLSKSLFNLKKETGFSEGKTDTV